MRPRRLLRLLPVVLVAGCLTTGCQVGWKIENHLPPGKAKLMVGMSNTNELYAGTDTGESMTEKSTSLTGSVQIKTEKPEPSDGTDG